MPKELTAGPRVEAITVQDEDMRVQISNDTIEVWKIGPQGGIQKSPVRYTRAEFDRLLALLELARRHHDVLNNP